MPDGRGAERRRSHPDWRDRGASAHAASASRTAPTAMRVAPTGERRRLGSERLCGAGRPEQDGGEEDEVRAARVQLFHNRSAASAQPEAMHRDRRRRRVAAQRVDVPELRRGVEKSSRRGRPGSATHASVVSRGRRSSSSGRLRRS
jgi:hypothetical protein